LRKGGADLAYFLEVNGGLGKRNRRGERASSKKTQKKPQAKKPEGTQSGQAEAGTDSQDKRLQAHHTKKNGEERIG